MIGETLKRRKSAPGLPARVRVLGQSGSSWICTDADEFGPTISLSVAEIAASFEGAPISSPQDIDEIALRRPAGNALRHAMAGYRAGDLGSDAPADGADPSPEDVFRAADAVRP